MFLTLRWWATLIVVMAVVLRLGVTAWTFHGNDAVTSWEDVAIAKNLMEGKGYSIDNTWRSRMLYEFLKIESPDDTGYRATTLKPPVFPFVLVLLFSLFGFGNYLVVFVLNGLLSGATAFLLYSALRRQSQSVALVAALTFAAYPPFVFQSATTPESTGLLLCLISLFFYQCSLLGSSTPRRGFFWLGVTGGLMVMTNPVSLLFVGCGAGLMAAVSVQRKFAANAVCFCCALCLVVCPWIARNQLVFGKPVMKSALGHTILKARYESGQGLWIPVSEIAEVEVQGRSLDEVQEDELLLGAVWPAVRHNWGQFIRQIATNLAHFWWEPHRYHNDYSARYLLGRQLPYVLLLGLSLMSMSLTLLSLVKSFGRSIQENRLQCLALLLVVSDTIVFSTSGAWNLRYHFPSEFAMLVFSSQTLAALLNRFAGWTPSEKLSTSL